MICDQNGASFDINITVYFKKKVGFCSCISQDKSMKKCQGKSCQNAELLFSISLKNIGTKEIIASLSTNNIILL